MIRSIRMIALTLIAIIAGSGCRTTSPYPLAPMPAGKAPFYCQHVSCGGFPVLSSNKVSHYALAEAAYLIDNMLATRPDVRQALINNKIHMAVMAETEFVTDVPEYAYLRPKPYWDRRARGLGPIDRHPVVSVGAENLLQYPGDPYHTESILVHEFAHAIHHMGLNTVDKSFDDTLEKTYASAMKKGLWKGKYASTNAAEYWAEGVQSYFGNNRPPDHDHNHVDTRPELAAYDPDLAHLIDTVFKGSTWQFTWPHERPNAKHLRGYDPTKAPTFSWPERLSGDWWKYLPEGYLQARTENLTTLCSGLDEGEIIDIFLLNHSGEVRYVHWVDYDGKPIKYKRLRSGESFSCGTYLSHPWLVTDKHGKPLQAFFAHPKKTVGIIK